MITSVAVTWQLTLIASLETCVVLSEVMNARSAVRLLVPVHQVKWSDQKASLLVALSLLLFAQCLAKPNT